MAQNPKPLRLAERRASRDLKREARKPCGHCGCCPCLQVGCEYCPAGGRRKREPARLYFKRIVHDLYRYDPPRLSDRKRHKSAS